MRKRYLRDEIGAYGAFSTPPHEQHRESPRSREPRQRTMRGGRATASDLVHYLDNHVYERMRKRGASRRRKEEVAPLFNMRRTLSRGKVGPGPDILGQALSLSQPSCGDLGVSFRRSSLQFNIRPWRTSALGNPLLRLGLPRRNDSLCTRVAPAALAKKETGVRPNGLGFGRRMGWIALCRRGLP